MNKEQIKKLRSDLRLNQKQLAESIGVSFATVSRWENGSGIPSDHQIEQLKSLHDIVKEDYIDKEKVRVSILQIGLASTLLLAVFSGVSISTPLLGKIGGFLGRSNPNTILTK